MLNSYHGTTSRSATPSCLRTRSHAFSFAPLLLLVLFCLLHSSQPAPFVLSYPAAVMYHPKRICLPTRSNFVTPSSGSVLAYNNVEFRNLGVTVVGVTFTVTAPLSFPSAPQAVPSSIEWRWTYKDTSTGYQFARASPSSAGLQSTTASTATYTIGFTLSVPLTGLSTLLETIHGDLCMEVGYTLYPSGLWSASGTVSTLGSTIYLMSFHLFSGASFADLASCRTACASTGYSGIAFRALTADWQSIAIALMNRASATAAWIGLEGAASTVSGVPCCRTGWDNPTPSSLQVTVYDSCYAGLVNTPNSSYTSPWVSPCVSGRRYKLTASTGQWTGETGALAACLCSNTVSVLAWDTTSRTFSNAVRLRAPTPSVTMTNEDSSTRTATMSLSASQTGSREASETMSGTVDRSASPSVTQTQSVSPSTTSSPTLTTSVSQVATHTMWNESSSPTVSMSAEVTGSLSQDSPSRSSSGSAPFSATSSLTDRRSRSASGSPSRTLSRDLSASRSLTVSASTSLSATPSPSFLPSNSRSASHTQSSSATLSSEPTLSRSRTGPTTTESLSREWNTMTASDPTESPADTVSLSPSSDPTLSETHSLTPDETATISRERSGSKSVSETDPKSASMSCSASDVKSVSVSRTVSASWTWSTSLTASESVSSVPSKTRTASESLSASRTVSPSRSRSEPKSSSSSSSLSNVATASKSLSTTLSLSGSPSLSERPSSSRSHSATPTAVVSMSETESLSASSSLSRDVSVSGASRSLSITKSSSGLPSSSVTSTGTTSLTMSESESRSMSMTQPAPSASITGDDSATSSSSLTPEASRTISGERSESRSSSWSAQRSLTRTNSDSGSPSHSDVQTVSRSDTAMASQSSSDSSTSTQSASDTASESPSKEESLSKTVSRTVTSTDSVSLTPTASVLPTLSPSTTPSDSPTVSHSLSATDSRTPTNSATTSSSNTDVRSASASSTPSVDESASDTLKATPSLTKTKTPTPSPSTTLTESVSPDDTHSSTSSRTVTWLLSVSRGKSLTKAASPSGSVTWSDEASLSHSWSSDRTQTATLSDSTSSTSSATRTAPTATLEYSTTMSVSPTATEEMSETRSLTETWSVSLSQPLTATVVVTGSVTVSEEQTLTDSREDTLTKSITVAVSETDKISSSTTISESMSVTLSDTEWVSASTSVSWSGPSMTFAASVTESLSLTMEKSQSSSWSPTTARSETLTQQSSKTTSESVSLSDGSLTMEQSASVSNEATATGNTVTLLRTVTWVPTPTDTLSSDVTETSTQTVTPPPTPTSTLTLSLKDERVSAFAAFLFDIFWSFDNAACTRVALLVLAVLWLLIVASIVLALLVTWFQRSRHVRRRRRRQRRVATWRAALVHHVYVAALVPCSYRCVALHILQCAQQILGTALAINVLRSNGPIRAIARSGVATAMVYVLAPLFPLPVKLISDHVAFLWYVTESDVTKARHREDKRKRDARIAARRLTFDFVARSDDEESDLTVSSSSADTSVSSHDDAAANHRKRRQMRRYSVAQRHAAEAETHRVWRHDGGPFIKPLETPRGVHQGRGGGGDENFSELSFHGEVEDVEEGEYTIVQGPNGTTAAFYAPGSKKKRQAASHALSEAAWDPSRWQVTGPYIDGDGNILQPTATYQTMDIDVMDEEGDGEDHRVGRTMERKGPVETAGFTDLRRAAEAAVSADGSNSVVRCGPADNLHSLLVPQRTYHTRLILLLTIVCLLESIFLFVANRDADCNDDSGTNPHFGWTWLIAVIIDALGVQVLVAVLRYGYRWLVDIAGEDDMNEEDDGLHVVPSISTRPFSCVHPIEGRPRFVRVEPVEVHTDEEEGEEAL